MFLRIVSLIFALATLCACQKDYVKAWNPDGYLTPVATNAGAGDYVAIPITGRLIPGRAPDRRVARSKLNPSNVPVSAKASPSPFVEDITASGPTLPGANMLVFDTALGVVGEPSFVGGGIHVDLEIAVGTNHVLVISPKGVTIFDKSGNELVAPSFFGDYSETSECTTGGDPNALYDDWNDRYFIGWANSHVGSGWDSYCFAVSITNDPTGDWHIYRIPGVYPTGGGGLDRPKAGLGEDAVFVAAFTSGTEHNRLWAIDKSLAYSGSAIASFPTVSYPGPALIWPVNLRGANQGTVPSDSHHYFIGSDDGYDGSSHDSGTLSVLRWVDPLGGGSLGLTMQVDLDEYTLDPGSEYPPTTISGAWDVLPNLGAWFAGGADFRNGAVWISQKIACNMGFGTVVCQRWAQIDPQNGRVLQTGVFADPSNAGRLGSRITANHCDDVLYGYTKMSSSVGPSLSLTGRFGDDPHNEMLRETDVITGILPQNCNCPTGFVRWVDYTGATSDPDGSKLWYAGMWTGVQESHQVSVVAVDFNCNTAISPVATLSATSLNSGYVTAPSSDEQLLTISNTGQRDLLIHDVTFTGAGSEAFSIASDNDKWLLAPGDTRDLGIVFSPSSFGVYSAQLSIQTNNPTSPTASVQVTGEKAKLVPMMAGPFAILTPVDGS